MNTNVAPVATLRVTRLIKAPRERVFAAWTTPEEIMKWFGPDGCKVLSAKVDLRTGGQYRIRVEGCENNGRMAVSGVYREIKAPSRLVYTWSWTDESEAETSEPVDTLVTVDFLDKEGFTEVQITHDRFPNSDMRDRHSHGWTGTLEKLDRLLACAQARPEPGSFGWNDLLAADPATAGAFYGQLFGWKAEKVPGIAGVEYQVFKIDDRMIGGMTRRPNPQAPPSWLAYVIVENVNASTERAAKLGAHVCMPPTDIPDVGRIAVITDPEGVPLGMFQPGR